MLFEAWMLSASLVSMGIMAEDQSFDVALTSRDAVLIEGSYFSGVNGPLKTTKLLVVWTGRESAGRPWLDGDCRNGTCYSLGRMQFRVDWLYTSPLKEFSVNRKEVLADGALQMRMALRLLIHLRDWCGSEEGGLHAYASGSCKGNKSSAWKIKDRCKLIGGCW